MGPFVFICLALSFSASAGAAVYHWSRRENTTAKWAAATAFQTLVAAGWFYSATY